MSVIRNVTLAAIFVCCSHAGISPALAQEAAAQSEAPSLLDRAVNPVRVNSLRVYGQNQTHSTIDSDVQGGKAVRIVVAAAGTNPWDVTAASVSSKAVEEGDKLVLAVWLRSEAGGTSAASGRATLRLQQTTAPYTGVAAERIEVKPEWTLYFIKGTSPQAFAAGALAANVQLASQAQTIDVGPVFILAMGPAFDLDTIPAN